MDEVELGNRYSCYMMFLAVWANLPSILFPGGHNGTGYLDGLVGKAELCGSSPMVATADEMGRKVILIKVSDTENIVLFERYLNECVITSNSNPDFLPARLNKVRQLNTLFGVGAGYRQSKDFVSIAVEVLSWFRKQDGDKMPTYYLDEFKKVLAMVCYRYGIKEEVITLPEDFALETRDHEDALIAKWMA